MNKGKIAVEEPAKPANASAAQAKHDSNPFTTSKLAIERLFKTNASTTVGVAGLSIVAAIIMGVAVLVSAIAAIAFLLMQAPELTLSGLPSELSNAVGSFNAPAIYTSWAISTVIFIICASLVNNMFVKLGVLGATGTKAGVGEIFRISLKRMLPMVGLGLLLVLAVILVILAIAILGELVGPAAILVGVIAAIALIYLAIRVSYAQFSIIEENASPVAALKQSWHLSRGHFGDTIGIIMVALLLGVIVGGAVDVVTRIFAETPLATFIAILGLIINMVAAAAASASFALRYVQLRQIQEGKLKSGSTHYLNYVAIVLALVALMIVGALSPTGRNTQNGSLFDTMNQTDNGYQTGDYRLN